MTSEEVLENGNFVPDENDTITLNLVENEHLVHELDDPEVVIGQIDLLANNDADKTQIWENIKENFKNSVFDQFYVPGALEFAYHIEYFSYSKIIIFGFKCISPRVDCEILVM